MNELWTTYRDITKRLEEFALKKRPGSKKAELEVLEANYRLIRFLLVVLQLYNAFRQVRSGKLQGDDGVAKSLGVSRHGIYVRIEAIGAKVTDFKRIAAGAPVGIDDLLSGNKVLSEIVVTLKKSLMECDRPPDITWPRERKRASSLA